MGETGTLSTKQRRFMAALLAEPTTRAAARVAGVSETCAWRWLRTDPVRSELASQQDAMLGQAAAALVSDMAEARQCLLDTLRDAKTPASVKVRAAAVILDCGLRLFEMRTLAERVAELERRVSNDTANAAR